MTSGACKLRGVNLGMRLRRAREARGISQSELARRVGVRPQTVQQWEDGATQPKRARWAALRDELQVPAEFFLDDGQPGVRDEKAGYHLSLAADERDLILHLRTLPVAVRHSIQTLISWHADKQ